MICKISFCCSSTSLSGEISQQVFDNPSTYHTIVWHNDYRYKTGKNTHKLPSFMNFSICGQWTLFCLSSYSYFCGEKSETECKCKYQINNQKQSSTVLGRQIWESPYIPQSHCTSCRCKHKTY